MFRFHRTYLAFIVLIALASLVANAQVAICPVEIADSFHSAEYGLLNRGRSFLSGGPNAYAPVVERKFTPLVLAPANVFLRNPFDGQIAGVLLEGLFGDGTRLEGEYVRAASERLDGPVDAAPGLNGADYRFEADTSDAMPCITDLTKCSRFDAVNLYYHIDQFARVFWAGQLGLSITFQADAKVHISGDGAFANPALNIIKFRVGDLFNKNAALSADYIYHEYTHLIVNFLGFEFDSGASEETLALHEAYADYFTASYSDDHRIGEWVVACPDRQHCVGGENDTDLRTLELSKQIWNWNQGAPSPSLRYGYCLRFHEGDLKCKESYNNDRARYVWGMIWAATLWDLRKDLGAPVVDQIVMEAVKNHRPGARFNDALTNILQADQTLFALAHFEEIRLAFENRGFVVPIVDAVESREMPLALQIGVWPNPSSGQINLTISTRIAGLATISVADMNGREVLFRNLGFHSPGRVQLNVSTSNLASGVYVVTARVGASVAFHKIVVTR